MENADNLFGEPISTYSDSQALEDGVLVEIPGEGGVNRATRAVFDEFVHPIGNPRLGVLNITPLMDVVRSMLKIEPDADGWRTVTYQGKELWLIPNEIGGLTLMFTEAS